MQHYREIAELWKATGWGRYKLAEATGYSQEQCRAAIAWAKKNKPNCVSHAGTTIRTVDALIEEAQVDLEKWEITHPRIRKWDTPMDGGQVQNFYVAFDLVERNPTTVEQAIASLIRKVPAIERMEAPQNLTGSTLEIGIVDQHFGMLSWNKETGEDWDLKIAKETYIRAAATLLHRAQGFEINKILLPIGNDMFHINDQSNTTPRGKHILDTDCRLAKVFEAGIEAVTQVVGLCLSVAPVELIFVPGNHDPDTGYYLCKVLEAVYDKCPDVTVDAGPKSRKYRKIGRNLIGYTHGADEKHDSLPLIMATNCPDDWATTDIREWHVAHFHTSKQTKYIAGDTFNGVGVVVMPSLVSADKWHYGKGYTRPSKHSEAYVWHPEEGKIATLRT